LLKESVSGATRVSKGSTKDSLPRLPLANSQLLVSISPTFCTYKQQALHSENYSFYITLWRECKVCSWLAEASNHHVLLSPHWAYSVFGFVQFVSCLLFFYKMYFIYLANSHTIILICILSALQRSVHLILITMLTDAIIHFIKAETKRLDKWLTQSFKLSGRGRMGFPPPGSRVGFSPWLHSHLGSDYLEWLHPIWTLLNMTLKPNKAGKPHSWL
jgi:hypothetical protein